MNNSPKVPSADKNQGDERLLLDRRRFLAGCAACAFGAFGTGGLMALAAKAAGAEAVARPKVKLVFSYPSSESPIWPNIGYDFDKRKKELTTMLTKYCHGLDLTPVTVMNADQADKLLQEDKKSDGFLIYILGLWSGAPRVIGASGRPCIFADDLYGGSGEFLSNYAAARRNNWKVAGVSSSRVEDVAAAAECFRILKQPGGSVEAFLVAADNARKAATKQAGDMKCPEDPVQTIPIKACLKKMKSCKILTVGGGWGMPTISLAIRTTIGARVEFIQFEELHQAYLDADRVEAGRWADKWSAEAEKIVEPKPKDIQDSGAMYIAMLELLKRHKAQAITINCLGGFYGKHITAYPCLGFRQLNDDGLVGACESDIRSTLTMLVAGALTGRPGFISDPVIDTSKGQIIYAHCVGPTKVFGQSGPSSPFHIRSHSEDRKGAAIRSLLPLGYMTTSLEIDCEARQIIMHQGKTVENVDEDKACRTKLAAEVRGDIDKLFCEWDRWGWHRVTFYGDIKPEIEALADALHFSIIEEA